MAKTIETCKYKIVVKYIDNIDIFIEEDADMLWQIESSLRDNSGFVRIGKKLLNKKDIIYIEALKVE